MEGRTNPRIASPRLANKVRRALGRALKKKPSTVRERLRIARAYRLLGEAEEAARWYRPVVDELARKGEPLKAIAIASELVRASPRHRRVLDDLATRYARGVKNRVALPLAPRVATPLEPVIRDDPEAAAKARALLADDRVVDALSVSKVYKLADLGITDDDEPEEPGSARRRAELARAEHEIDDGFADAPGVRPNRVSFGLDATPKPVHLPPPVSPPSPAPPASLPDVPLFGSLPRAAFIEAVANAKLRSLAGGEVLFGEGEPATSFHVVVEGELEGYRRLPDREVILSRVGVGEALGVFGLFSGRTRAAGVRATQPSAVLEIESSVLADLVKKHPSARPALRKFYQDRLVLSFLGSSPLFCDLPLESRQRLIEQFKERELAAREQLVAPGEVVNGLWLVVRGGVSISRRSGGAKVEEIARLERGHFFGVVAALAGRPAQATAAARGETTLAELSHRAFNEFVRQHPELRQLPARLEQHGLMASKEFFVGAAGIPGFAA